MQVEQFLDRTAARLPRKTALVCGDARLTYQEVQEQSDRLARVFIERGVERGDRVAICLENSVEAVVSIFAALKAGGVFMMINPGTKPDKLRFLLEDSRAAALVCDARRSRLVQARRHDFAHLRVVVAAGRPLEPPDPPDLIAFSAQPSSSGALPNRCIDVDLAALIYTSGSTGRPKGVMLTHLNIVSAATSITTYLENTESDIILDALPLSFDYGLYQVLMAFLVGATVVVERSFAYPHATLETMVRERVTGLPIVPTMSAILLRLDLGAYHLGSLRYLTNTGAALPTRHIADLRRALPHVRMYSMYGLTECKRVSYLPPEEIDRRPDSVGRGMPNEEVYIVDASGRRLASGIGELVIRGSNVMAGYWERPEETARVLKPGPLPHERVLFSGDLFRMDEEGYLYFIGRMDDIIKTRGEKVSPKEVEEVLYRCDGVAEAAVFGVPDEVLGEAVKAVVTLREGASLTPTEILRHCAQYLEDFMMPREIEIRATMPKTATGKISKIELQSAAG